MLTAAAVAGTDVIANIGTKMASSALRNPAQVTSKSLSEYSAELQLRPTIAIEKEILNDDNMGTLVNTGISNYAGYYIVALSIDNTINGVSLGKSLSKYNPSRDAKSAAFNVLGETIAKVSTASYVPRAEQSGVSLSTLSRKIGSSTSMGIEIPRLPAKYLREPEVSLEFIDTSEVADAFSDSLDKAGDVLSQQSKDELQNNEDAWKSMVLNKDGGKPKIINDVDDNIKKEINKMSNLAAGKILNVDISRDGQSASVDVLLKPELKSISSRGLVSIAGIAKQPKTIRERWNAFWDRGTILSAWDYITCRDLVKAHERNLVEDTTGYYEKVHNRKVNNAVAAGLTGEFSVGTIANTWIVSDTTAARIESVIGAKLKNTRKRNQFMEESGCMTLIVYSPDYQRVFIYNHGLEDISEISMNYLQKKEKSASFDMDVFKMLSQGSAPII